MKGNSRKMARLDNVTHMNKIIIWDFLIKEWRFYYACNQNLGYKIKGKQGVNGHLIVSKADGSTFN